VNPWPILAPSAAVCGTLAWGAVHPTAQLFGPALHNTSDRKEVALTFDDGPNPSTTPRLLELLEEQGSKATFFLVGRTARLCPQIVREIAARGHLIGNHTESHPSLALRSTRRIEEELRRCAESLDNALGGSGHSASLWMRPPFGFRGPQLWPAVRRARLRGVAMWSLTCYDWKPQPPSRLIDRLRRVTELKTGPGEIVLLHDGDFRRPGADRSHVVAALKYWLPRWKDAGLKFVTMNDVASASEADSARGE